MKGGRKGNFYFCLIDYFEEHNRWFLKSLLQVKDEGETDGDEIVRSWIQKYSLTDIVVDFPLSTAACQSCELICPGADSCPVENVKYVNNEIQSLLLEDRDLELENPKQYERDRLDEEQFLPLKDVMARSSYEHLLSRSFKRKLKKGFLPYWNRPLDFWVWQRYYDQMISLFNVSFDSFGNTSLMMLSRFSYLKRHFPKNLELFEGNVYLILLELLRSKVISKSDIVNLSDLDLGPKAKQDIIKKIETKFNIFIYDHDLDILIKSPRAFDSFLLALAGQRLLKGSIESLPDWTAPLESRFVVPKFHTN